MIEQSSRALLTLIGLLVIGCLIAAGILLSRELKNESVNRSGTGSSQVTDEATNDDPQPVGGDARDPQFTEDGRKLFEGDLETYYRVNQDRLANASNCLAGNAFPSLGQDLLYPIDAEEYGDDAFIPVLESIFDSSRAESMHEALKEGPDSMNYGWICNPDDGTAIVVLSTENITGKEYSVRLLSEDSFNGTWRWEGGETLFADQDETLYVYSDGNLEDLGQTPILWFQNAYLGDVNRWRIYEFDTFFGHTTPVENCEIVAVQGQQYTACEVYN